ncbi:site-specific integrase [Streptacidiphilus sp. PB12-B1b]|uniref:tyrosine-type recombinase/integrase n=1 Tax=Streptacidiphilus sp. PB12-B1b TaxID=2705012 RepID=UPI001CDB4D83|nr:site-specific integrase [Streptacidiphilus sp. PB12-B1b]
MTLPKIGPLAAGPVAADGRPQLFALDRFDQRPGLLDQEAAALAALDLRALRRQRAHGGIPRRTAVHWRALTRLVDPLDQALHALHHDDEVNLRRAGAQAAAVVLANCRAMNRSWWGWTPWDWARLCSTGSTAFRTAQELPTDTATRPFLISLGYLLGGFTDFQHLGHFNRLHLAQLLFGPEAIEAAMGEVAVVADRWGYRSHNRDDGRYRLPGVLAQALLINRSPRLEDLTTEVFARLQAHPATGTRYASGFFALQKILADLGHCHAPVRPGFNHAPTLAGVPEPWSGYLQRWYDTSVLTANVRNNIRTNMAKAGRWLAAEHPEAVDPAHWTRATCADWVAAVDRMAVGDYVQRSDHLHDRLGDPIAPRTKAHILMGTRTFLRDLQEWEWMPRRFDTARALAVPRTIAALIATDPRVIADEIWAKLLWAGLNLQAPDLPGTSAGSYYPLELIRSLALTWLFSGLRSDEISRLRVGCVRWQHEGQPIDGASREVLADQAVCLLDVPVNKTNTAFTKPVDPIVGQAIEAWQALRPAQPKRLDAKTSEHVDLLFSIRAHPVAKNYINRTLIPSLCEKAGVPTADVRGNITSHRARSTIASQLYNAKEPMTLFELQAWLGHRSPVSTQHYAKITPNTLTRAYTEAGYFSRNLRTIEVLVDRDAVASGAAAGGVPWQHYDLGHGYCTYSFFEQCQHRMACARCDFYTPKDSTQAQLLEAKANLQRMLVSIPLTDDERAAVDDGQAALDALLDRLAETPTPAGPSPLELNRPTASRLLPIIEVRQGTQR